MQMADNTTEIVFILDRSGSMGGLEDDTIGGFNSMLAKNKKSEGEAYVTTILFDDKVETLHDREDIKEVKPITENEYYVRGCTALLDAVGRTISHIASVHKSLKENKPQKTIFIITTDGQENASKEYNKKTVKDLIEKQKKESGWEFIFLGANIDAAETAESIGIDRKRAVNYRNDSKGVQINFDVMGSAIQCMMEAPMRMMKSRKSAADECCAEACPEEPSFDEQWEKMRGKIDEDFQNRK